MLFGVKGVKGVKDVSLVAETGQYISKMLTNSR